MNEIRRQALYIIFRKSVTPFCKTGILQNCKIGEKSCSTFPLIIGINFFRKKFISNSQLSLIKGALLSMQKSFKAFLIEHTKVI